MKYPDKNQGSIPQVPQEKKWKSVGLIQIDKRFPLNKGAKRKVEKLSIVTE